jgi:hypothetical protein
MEQGIGQEGQVDLDGNQDLFASEVQHRQVLRNGTAA